MAPLGRNPVAGPKDGADQDAFTGMPGDGAHDAAGRSPDTRLLGGILSFALALNPERIGSDRVLVTECLERGELNGQGCLARYAASTLRFDNLAFERHAFGQRGPF